mmetsp:Transcript_225/g.467  ORF Transcript_225/g.467 Transcript_225/m.467 type:complete len:116 (-) Transcript_225:1341-1688(-)
MFPSGTRPLQPQRRQEAVNVTAASAIWKKSTPPHAYSTSPLQVCSKSHCETIASESGLGTGCPACIVQSRSALQWFAINGNGLKEKSVSTAAPDTIPIAGWRLFHEMQTSFPEHL